MTLIHAKNPGLKEPTPESTWNWAVAHSPKTAKWFRKECGTVADWALDHIDDLQVVLVSGAAVALARLAPVISFAQSIAKV